MKLFRRSKNVKIEQVPVKEYPKTSSKEDAEKLNALVKNLNATIGKVAGMPEVKEAMEHCDAETSIKMKKSTFVMKCMHTKRPTREDLSFVEEYPNVCREKDCWGCTPLAYILQNDPPLDTVQYLVEKYPAAVRQGNLGCAMYPIHKAVRYGASSDVVKYLIDQWPEGAKTFTSRKLLPLHLACLNTHTSGVIDVLLEAYPEAASIPFNDSGELPLFKACFCQLNLEVITALVKAYPKAVSTRGTQGCYPVSALCAHKDANVESVKHLVNLFPKAIQIKDDAGAVPVHYACFNGAAVDLIEYLVDQYPQAIFSKTKNGKTCRAMAVEAGHAEIAAFVKAAEKKYRKFSIRLW
ncbi:MAG: hypothetical protein SGILL_002450 [Bacillariaceae sp.]